MSVHTERFKRFGKVTEKVLLRSLRERSHSRVLVPDMPVGVGVIISTGQREPSGAHKRTRVCRNDRSTLAGSVAGSVRMKNIQANFFQLLSQLTGIILIVLYIGVCCVEAFEKGQL